MLQSPSLPGMMMNRPLLISSIIEFAAETYPDTEIVSATVEGSIHRYGYADARKRIIKLANALLTLGVKPGDRVATLAWNGYRHFELYYAISGIGAVCHTINPRLFDDQLTYIANHAADTYLFFDTTFSPIVERLRPAWPKTMQYVALCDRERLPKIAGVPDLLCYEDLLVSSPETIQWPEFDENAAASLCYTSGTTGEPKGVLYSHRSTLLHTFFAMVQGRDSFAPGTKLLPIVPLFHANAWGLPYITPMAGVGLVFPGMKLDGPSLFELMDGEGVYSAWGVPTVHLGLIAEIEKRGRKPKGFGEILTGGSAAPLSMIETYEKKLDVRVVHGWGMTEMSPIGTMSRLTPKEATLPVDKQIELKSLQGRRMFGVDIKIVDEDGKTLPHDGEAFGELFVRGNAIVKGYFNNDAATARSLDTNGWFGTGDVAKIRPDGFLVIVDRTKDLVKSGGEWISSIDVENMATGHPAVAQAAVIAMPHPRWNERPLLIAVKNPGQNVTKEELTTYLGQHLAKWQLPDDVVFVDAIPLTATGKISKLTLRKTFADYVLPTAKER
jgi:3-(methylthio)propionyl---CoA ligase